MKYIANFAIFLNPYISLAADQGLSLSQRLSLREQNNSISGQTKMLHNDWSVVASENAKSCTTSSEAGPTINFCSSEIYGAEFIKKLTTAADQSSKLTIEYRDGFKSF